MVTQQDITQWYDQRHQQDAEHAWRPPQAYEIFLDWLSVGASAEGKLLDVGCGTGYLLSAAASRGLQAAGVDISQQAVKISQTNAPQADVRQVADEQLPFEDQSFDYVTCLGVLEHYIDMASGLSEMNRVARPGARFCIMVPNSRFLLWLLKGQPGTEQQDINEHLLNLVQWRQLFELAGLRVLHVHQDSWFKVKTRIFSSWNPLRILFNAGLKLGWSLLPLAWTYQFVFIMEKPDNTHHS